jgi:predicted peptidase
MKGPAVLVFLLTPQPNWGNFMRALLKNLSHVLVIAALAATSCSKEEDASIEPLNKGSETAVTSSSTWEFYWAQTPVNSLISKTLPANVGNVSKNYVLYVPSTYNNNYNKWPLVIFLHGIGEMGTDLNKVKSVGLCRVVKGKQFVMVAPQCLSGWWNTSSLNEFLKQIIPKFHVDPKRIYLTGLSMGGYGTWDWAENYASQFAAIVPISGGGDVNKACNLKTMPIWAFHNANDPTVSVTNSRDMVKAIKACGSTKIKYTENATGGHDAWTKAYADPNLYTWLLAQHK